MFYEVIPTEVFRNGGGVLTYSSSEKLLPGQIVIIPLGKRSVTGVVYRRVASVDFPTKPITRLLCPFCLPKHLLKAIFWLAQYYLTSVPVVADMLVPAGLNSRNAFKGYLEPAGGILTTKSRTTAVTLKNAVVGDFEANNGKMAKTSPQNSTKIAQNCAKSAQKGENSVSNPANSHQNSPNLAQNVSEISQKSFKIPQIPLNQAQKTALLELKQAPGYTRLLRGITGSGKTNIYLTLAAETLQNGQTTILLVPEIALTSQLVQIFEQTFGQQVRLIHSQQTMTERRKTWLDVITSPEPSIIIGPRSALLAPVHNLGLIIIDEAHEGAYYQENTPRYSALRLASFIAATQKIPCILGTATPNLVDYHLAKTKKSLVELRQKAKTTAITAKTIVVDFKDRANFAKNRYFSNALLAAISNNLKQHHQTLIFHNRRGSAPITLCESCGWQALCPECYLPMILHADTYTLTCHICGHEQKVPMVCPECGHPEVVHKGFGTKLLEAELKTLFPQARIARFDGDNKKTDDLASLYDTVHDGEIDILIGTQTLARGLDLPHLATVGIVQADAGLSLPDFAAEERSFELLTQVIGRVGRGHLAVAEVYVQSYQPDHPVIQTALKADYAKFAEYLLQKRRLQAMPPFTYLARLSITYKTERTTLQKIRQAHAELSKIANLTVLPPMPAFHERTNRGFTWQIIAKSPSRETLRQALLPYAGNSQYGVVLDPPSLL